ncbi:MAG: hypothetical protein II627_04890 [Lachnospiraceae bacterium]|nr:hypothetical protein [Lachnospiraceae bacterium]
MEEKRKFFYGWIMMLGSMAGSPLAGLIFDKTGSYAMAYIVFAIAAAAAAVMLMITKKPAAMEQ